MIKQKKLSDVIAERLESMIVDGTLSAGEKLLPERELALQFDVSRPSLREAIQNLQAKGLIERKQGGGTFVSSHLKQRVSDPLLALISKRPETQFDLLEFRHALEGMAAFYAAFRGQQQDYQTLSQLLKQIDQSDASDLQTQANALADFYLTMAKASQNMVLVQVMQAMREMLADNVKQNLAMLRNGFTNKEELQQTMSKHRWAIVEAIGQADPKAARDASNEHLSYIEQTLLDISTKDARMQRKLRRIIN